MVRAAALSAVPPGGVTEVEIEGKPYAICNVEGRIHVLDGVCPHHGGPLGQGALAGVWVTCPWHGWSFDCRTGASAQHGDLRQRTFAAAVENGEVLLDLP